MPGVLTSRGRAAHVRGPNITSLTRPIAVDAVDAVDEVDEVDDDILDDAGRSLLR
jgi:hypothetical protein